MHGGSLRLIGSGLRPQSGFDLLQKNLKLVGLAFGAGNLEHAPQPAAELDAHDRRPAKLRFRPFKGAAERGWGGIEKAALIYDLVHVHDVLASLPLRFD